jgi:hypothetical protein
MRFIMIVFTCMILATASSLAQPALEWSSALGTAEQDYVRDIELVDDGYVFVGEYITGSPPYMTKVDFDGNEVWRLDLVTLDVNAAEYIALTPNGEFLVSRRGSVNNTVENQLVWYDENGTYIRHIFAGDINTHIEHKPLFFPDGDALIAGITDGDLFLTRMTDAGDIVWHKVSENLGMPECIRMQNDGSIVVLAKGHNEPMVLVHISAAGIVQDARAYDPGPQNYPESFAPTDDGGFLILLNKYAAYLHRGIGAMRVDADGDVIWQREILPMETAYAAFGMEQLPNGGYIVHGDRYTGGGYDLSALRIDDEANILWERIPYGPGHDRGRSIVMLPGADFAQFGTTSSYGAGENDAWLVKYEPDVTGALSLTLVPHNAPVIIPAGGGSFSAYASLTNHSTTDFVVDVRLNAILPDESVYPLRPPLMNVLLGANAHSEIPNLYQSVPGEIAAGEYQIEAEVHHQGMVIQTAGFTVIKEGVVTGNSASTPPGPLWPQVQAAAVRN